VKQPKKILIIDDDQLHRLCAKEILQDAGYDVAEHASGLGATEAVMTSRPDLVLLDVNMPALPGTALAPLLRDRAQTRHVPILLYSSNDEDTLRRSARMLGLAGYVAKGDPDQLRREVGRVLSPGPLAGGRAPTAGSPPPGRPAHQA
jgi:CheY-like chemotaxis protein